MIRTAAYCRVSTDKEDQINSFDSQCRFFREYIEHHPGWVLSGIYADEGITGTSTKKRIQFNRMLDDAYGGKFNLIITKEVSRFSRNILDTIRYTRELKQLGIGVVFMADGFSTLDPDAELRLSIMGSIAQEESRKTSARVKWGQTRQMERGVVFGRSLLGYHVENGKLTEDPETAHIVRLIFQKYALEGKGTAVIARELTSEGYRTATGKTDWKPSGILKILKNEKYAGDLIQKKSITPDYLTHTKKPNHGEEALICIRDHHKPIIDRELWELTQQQIVRRNRQNRSQGGHSTRYLFSGKIRCGECGGGFAARTRTGKNGKFRRWCCCTAVRKGAQKPSGCDVGKHLSDALAMDILRQTICSLQTEHLGIIPNLSGIIAGCVHADPSQELQRKLQLLTQKKTASMDAYLSGDFTKEEMLALKKQYDQQITAIHAQMASSGAEGNRPEEIKRLITSILSCDTEYDAFYKGLLQEITVYKNGRITVKLNCLPHTWEFQLE